MILRKPYALLIKNFKKIHLGLLVLMIYLAYKSNNILNFFNDFIATGTFSRTSFSLSSSYVNTYMFLIAFFVALIALVIYILMRQKKKPKLLYLFIILFYLGLITYFYYMYNTLDTIEVKTLSPRDIRLIRDIVSIMCYIQYAVIIVIGIRAVGFNIKKFNFVEDLQELEIDVSDNEEFELTVGIDPNKISRTIRKSRREIKYFIIENFFILMLISFVTIITIGIVIFLNIKVYNKVYEQSESFRVGSFVNKINEVYYTNYNSRGDVIIPSDQTFVVLSTNFSNKDAVSHTISLDDINLISDKKIYEPITTIYQSFVDLGVGYINQTIKAKESKNYIIIFKVDKNINFNKLYLRYRESLVLNSQKIKAHYRNVKVEGIEINKIKTITTVPLNEILEFKNTPLHNSKMLISDMQIENKFIYDATYCISNKCSTYKSNITLEYTTTNKLLMKISSMYEKDSKTDLYGSDTLANVIKNYGFIRYTVNNKIYESEIINETPRDYIGEDLYYQVPAIIKDSKSIDLVIRIRDKEIIYKLK